MVVSHLANQFFVQDAVDAQFVDLVKGHHGIGYRLGRKEMGKMSPENKRALRSEQNVQQLKR